MSGTGAAPSEPEGGSGRYPVPRAARVLGISKRAVRKRIETGKLTAERDGARWLVILPAEPPGGTDTADRGTRAEPIEAAYRVDGAPASALVPLADVFDQLQAYTDRIERLSREAERATARAEAAEHERDALAARLETLQATQAAQDGPHGAGTPLRDLGGLTDAHEGTQTTPAPWWAFWRR